MAMDSQLSKKQIIKKNPILKYKYQKKVSYLMSHTYQLKARQ